MMVPHAPASAPAHLGTHFLTTCKISTAFFARFPVGRLFGWLAGRPGRPGCGWSWSRPNIRGHPRTGPGPPQPPAALAAGDGWHNARIVTYSRLRLSACAGGRGHRRGEPLQLGKPVHTHITRGKPATTAIMAILTPPLHPQPSSTI